MLRELSFFCLIYLGFGLLLTFFFPYFLHLYPSSSMSSSDFVMNPTFAPPLLFKDDELPAFVLLHEYMANRDGVSTS